MRGSHSSRLLRIHRATILEPPMTTDPKSATDMMMLNISQKLYDDLVRDAMSWRWSRLASHAEREGPRGLALDRDGDPLYETAPSAASGLVQKAEETMRLISEDWPAESGLWRARARYFAEEILRTHQAPVGEGSA